MQHLIIYAHPNTKSFCNAITHAIANVLEENHTCYHIRDLNALQFNPILSSVDLEKIYRKDSPIDIVVEQEYISNADFIHVVYPIWWTGLPAILKGYFDRVFHHGFGYVRETTGIKGLLTGKKVILYSTQGSNVEKYNESGMTKALSLTSDVGIFNFCGMEVIDHLYFGSIPRSDDKTRADILKQVVEMVAGIK